MKVQESSKNITFFEVHRKNGESNVEIGVPLRELEFLVSALTLAT